MRLVLLGAPGSGKGTQAAILAEALGVPPVSTGELFRDQAERGTELGRAAEAFAAVGDLVPTLQLAHVGFAEGILVAERLAGLKVVPIDYDGVPRVTYCQPEVASVGLTEAKAKEIYGADGIELSELAQKQIETYTRQGYSNLPSKCSAPCSAVTGEC